MKLNDLKNLCEKYNLKPKATKHRLNPDRYEVSMDDCIKAIQEYSMNLLKGTNYYDNNLEFILKMKSPMLALLISRQDKKTVNAIWDDNNTDWIFEEKLDGIRCFIAYNHLTRIYHIYSRALDQTTMLPIDYKDRVSLVSNPIPFDFVLDAELVFSNDMGHEVIEEILADPYKDANKYKPRFVVFDLVKLGDYSLIGQTLLYRRTEAFKVVNYLKQNGCNNIFTVEEKSSTMTKEEYYNYLVHKGYEGVIAKNLNSVYDIKGQRNGSWTKIKRMAHEGIGSLISDTYDLFVSGAIFSNNQVNGLVLSSYKLDNDNNYVYDSYGNRLTIELGIIYDLTPELKYSLTTYTNNKAELNANFIGRVLEIGSSGFDPITMKLNNMRFICWRLDKTQESCTIKEAELIS